MPFTKGHGLGLRKSENQQRPRINLLASAPSSFVVNKVLDLPYQYRKYYDQGEQGACVGFGYSWMMSILNRRRYDPFWLYNEAQLIDPWDDTPPESGTSEVSGGVSSHGSINWASLYNQKGSYLRRFSILIIQE